MTREERIKNARAILDGDCSDELRVALVNAFPELAESDDEKIRKAIIKLLKVPRKEIFEHEGITKEQAIAYLEKQKEQPGGGSEKPNSQPEGAEGIVHHALNCHYITAKKEQLDALLNQFDEGAEIIIYISAKKEESK